MNNKWKIDDSEVGLALAALEKCTKRLAAIAVRKRKFLSNQLKEGLFTAGIATRSTKSTEGLVSDAMMADQAKALAKNKSTGRKAMPIFFKAKLNFFLFFLKLFLKSSIRD